MCVYIYIYIYTHICIYICIYVWHSSHLIYPIDMTFSYETWLVFNILEKWQIPRQNNLNQLAENARFVAPSKCCKSSPLHPWCLVFFASDNSCHKYVLSQINESCHVAHHLLFTVHSRWHDSHPTSSHVTDESCYKWMSHVMLSTTRICDMTHPFVTRLTPEVESYHMCMSHVPYIRVSHTDVYECNAQRGRVMSRTNGSCQWDRMSHGTCAWVMLRIYEYQVQICIWV